MIVSWPRQFPGVKFWALVNWGWVFFFLFFFFRKVSRGRMGSRLPRAHDTYGIYHGTRKMPSLHAWRAWVMDLMIPPVL